MEKSINYRKKRISTKNSKKFKDNIDIISD